MIRGDALSSGGNRARAGLGSPAKGLQVKELILFFKLVTKNFTMKGTDCPVWGFRLDPVFRLGKIMTIASLLMRAIQIAESGEHIDCLTVESALVAEGYHEALEVFKDDRLRAGIRAICQKHWGSKAEGADNDNHPSLEGEQFAQSAQPLDSKLS
jgi:hypothetical protein